MKVDFTNEMVFGFEGPNLCLLGDENDFRKLAESILELTNRRETNYVELSSLAFIENVGEMKRVIFISKNGTNKLAVMNNKSDLIFELDWKCWERLFKYFVLMSWHKRTYYLNAYENYLDDFSLEQECNFICSSEF